MQDVSSGCAPRVHRATAEAEPGTHSIKPLEAISLEACWKNEGWGLFWPTLYLRAKLESVALYLWQAFGRYEGEVVVLDVVANVERDHIDGPVVAACLLPIVKHVMTAEKVRRPRMNAEAEPKREKEISKRL